MRAMVVLEDVGVKKMVPKHKLPKNIPLHPRKLNCGTYICELEDHVGEKGLNLKWPSNFGPTKKTLLASFPCRLLEKVWVEYVFFYAMLPHHDKAKHHWGSKRSKCQTTKLYGSYASLSNGKRNVIYTSHRETMGMWLYSRGRQRPKWKDPRTSNDETHVQANGGRVGTREGIEPEWS